VERDDRARGDLAHLVLRGVRSQEPLVLLPGRLGRIVGPVEGPERSVLE
jgi:hypothetical protein